MLDENIAQHAVDVGHWPGRTRDQVKKMISDVRAGAQSSFDFGNGRGIFRKGDVILIEDGKGGGTIFKPVGSALKYFRRKVKEGTGLT